MNYVNTTYFLENYNELTQLEFLNRLKKVGVDITQQTLRNWEKNGLITPPARGNGYGGRWTKYSEYVLIECYAAHMLLHVLPKEQMDKSVPKFSVELLAKARGLCRYHPKTIPEKPTCITEIMDCTNNQHIKIGDESISAIPSLWTERPENQLDEAFESYAQIAGENNFQSLLEFSLLLSAELLWFKYLCKGAELFWPKYE